MNSDKRHGSIAAPSSVPAAFLLLAILALGAVAALLVYSEHFRQDPDRIEIVGGGFLYNYRISEIRYNVAVRLVRPTPIGTRITAEFENPAGGPPLVVSRSLGTDTNRIGLESPALSGLETGADYRVVVHLIERDSGTIMETHERLFRATVDPELVPDAPLTVGPGYERKPDTTK